MHFQFNWRPKLKANLSIREIKAPANKTAQQTIHPIITPATGNVVVGGLLTEISVTSTAPVY